jgi:hypothetical protein
MDAVSLVIAAAHWPLALAAREAPSLGTRPVRNKKAERCSALMHCFVEETL